jgi:hypothetical protein
VCKKFKSLSNYGLNRSSKSKDGYHPECKLCVKKRKAIYYLQNKKNVDILDKIRKQLRRYTDLNFRLRGNLRARLNRALKDNQKGGSAIEDLGCSVDNLKSYLELQFKPGMSWENYGRKTGQWSIDHIFPLSKVNLADRNQFLKVCHYTNLQPLWVLDNLLKSNRIQDRGEDVQ